MKTRIFNLVIIDESGSMQSIKRQAIDSVNETFQTIRSAQTKHEDQEHYVSLVTFNDYVNIVYNCVPIEEVENFTSENYNPDCLTALYDAMGRSLNVLRRKVADVDRVLVTIVTDGLENASKEYNSLGINSLVSELKSKGWVFAYIGANHDVERVATKISISNTMSFEATREGTACMSSRLSSARERFYDHVDECCFSAERANVNFFDDEKQDDIDDLF